jgi:hypothetical protein
MRSVVCLDVSFLGLVDLRLVSCAHERSQQLDVMRQQPHRVRPRSLGMLLSRGDLDDDPRRHPSGAAKRVTARFNNKPGLFLFFCCTRTEYAI